MRDGTITITSGTTLTHSLSCHGISDKLILLYIHVSVKYLGAFMYVCSVTKSI